MLNSFVFICVLIKLVRHLLINPTLLHLGICESPNKGFATSAIQAIGRCAIRMNGRDGRELSKQIDEGGDLILARPRVDVR